MVHLDLVHLEFENSEPTHNGGAMKLKLTMPITLASHGYHKRYHLLAMWLKAFIEGNWEHISKMFNLPEEVHLRMRPLPKRSTHGTAGTRQLMINVATGSIREIIKTLFHELRHIEQSHTGRMKLQLVGTHWHTLWDGVDHGREVPAIPKLMDRYQAQPWEMDARSVEDDFTARLEAIIGYQLPLNTEIPK